MRPLLRVLLFVVASIAGGVSWAGGDASALDAAARRYWAAEVAQDWGAVYDLLSQSERTTFTRDWYATARKEKGPFHYVAAEIDEVAVAGDVGWVHVNHAFKLPQQPYVSPHRAEMWQLWQWTDGWHPVSPIQRDQWPKLPPRLRPAAEEEALAKRSAGFWQAMAGQDWKAVYGYMPPHYRAEIPLERFLKNKALNFYYAPRVEWAEVSDNGGRVKVVYAYKPADPAVSKLEPVQTAAVEQWVRADGNWYLDVPLPPPDTDAKAEKTK